MRRFTRGTSLGELLIAVSVLSVSLLGTASALHFGLQASGHGANYSEASHYARALLEVMLAENRCFSVTSLPSSGSGYNDAVGVNRPLDDPPFQQSDYRLRNVRFQRHIEVQNCSASGDPASVKAWKDDLRQVTVTVLWTEGTRRRTVSLCAYARRPR